MATTGAQQRYTTAGGVGGVGSVFASPNTLKHLLGIRGRSGFGSSSTAEQVAAKWDGSGKVVLITGASSGLGAESARVLAARGATIIALVRNVKAMEQVAQNIKQATPAADIRIVECVLEDLTSVVAAARAVLALGLPLHTLLLNAGVMAPPFSTTKQGLELQIGVNHVAHALLVRHLLPHVVATASAPGAPEGRIVVVSSVAHQAFTLPGGVLPADRINSAEGYDAWKAYGQSKLANVLFARELAVRLKRDNVANVAAVSLHPGGILDTNLSRHLTPAQRIGAVLIRPFTKTIPQGAATQVYVTTAAGALAAGEYYVDTNVARSSVPAHDAALGARLWAWTEQQVAPYAAAPDAAQQPISWA